MIDWRRSEKLVRDLVDRESSTLTIEVYDDRYMDYLEGQCEDVPEDEDKRGVIIIPQ